MFSSASIAASVLLLQTWFATPFLDLFRHRDPSAQLEERSVQLDAGRRRLTAYLVTPLDPPGESLPAVVLVSGSEGLTDDLRRFSREIAGIGYVTLAVDYRSSADPQASAFLQDIMRRDNELESVVAWLSSQPRVDRLRIGVVAWNDAFDAANGLRDSGKVTAVYPVKLASQVGVTEQEWVDVYEYLGKHVEDALLRQPASVETPIARVGDIMRAINSDQGVRGRLARMLADKIEGDRQWEEARSDAAVLAEAGNLLLAQRPLKGSIDQWRNHARDFRLAAEALLTAVERRDFALAQQRLRELPRSCAACHADHR
jgi:dienelactone hydrolase family protein